jgi:hypothetical protein
VKPCVCSTWSPSLARRRNLINNLIQEGVGFTELRPQGTLVGADKADVSRRA